MKTYSRKGGTTTSLKSHLKSVHATEYEELIKLETEKKNTVSVQPSTSTPLQDAKKQITLKETLAKNTKWCTSNPKSMEIDKLISEMIALQDLPFNFVEGIGFRRLMQFIVPNYHLRGRHFFTENICGQLYETAKQIKDLLTQIEKISFTTDIWTEPSSNVSLLSLTAHGINGDFRRLKVILKCHTFDGRHTGDLVLENIKSMLMEWDVVKEKIHCFVRDSGSNMIRAMKLGDIPDVSCTIHQLQLCVRTLLDCDEDIKALISKCKKISTHFNHSQIARTELHKIQKEQLNQECLSVIQECSTRWNSTFYMLQRMIRIQDSLCLYASKHNISQLSPEEWLQLKKIVTILQPFEEITRNMSDNNTSISSVIPLIHTLKYTLRLHTEGNKQDTNEKFKSIIKSTIDQLNSRFSDLQSNNFFAIATYLDPRYKTNFFNEVAKQNIETEIMSIFDAADTSKNEADNIVAPVEKRARMELPAETSHSSNVQSVLLNILLSSDEEDDNNTTLDKSPVFDKFVFVKNILNEFNKEKRISISDDPLLWWKVNGNIKFQPLQSIARQFLSCPPSSVASEQLFSGAGLIYDPLRNRLEGDKASKLLFVKYNTLLLESINTI
ncbi:hypothetical protein evm_014266 [Chilo suppressalis]|nr:hypothetical protein evm_014266 [Chilo suppressalis]